MKKKFIAILVALVFFSFSFVGCGDQKTINGITYDTYGVFNKGEKMNPDIRYQIIVGNVIWSIILVETIVFPVYFIGFSLWEPVASKDEPNIPGKVGG